MTLIIGGKTLWKKVRKMLSSTLKRSVVGFLKPPKCYNSLILNILGLQVIRILWHDFTLSLKRMLKPEMNDVARELDQSGYIIIENFFDDKTFSSIESQFEEDMKLKFSGAKDSEESIVAGEVHIKQVDIQEASCQSSFRELIFSESLRDVVKKLAQKPINTPVKCVLQESQQKDESSKGYDFVHGNSDFDVENILHQDHIYSVYKAWLYIEDITEENGAFVYVPNSHRFSWLDLKYQYLKSIFYCLIAKGKSHWVPEKFLDKGRIIAPKDYFRDLDLKPIPLEARANSLIIANTRGFHKRGRFSPGRARKLIHLDFRRIMYRQNVLPSHVNAKLWQRYFQ